MHPDMPQWHVPAVRDQTEEASTHRPRSCSTILSYARAASSSVRQFRDLRPAEVVATALQDLLVQLSLTLTPIKLELHCDFFYACSCRFQVSTVCPSSSAFCSVVRPTCSLVLPGPSTRYKSLRQDKQ